MENSSYAAFSFEHYLKVIASRPDSQRTVSVQQHAELRLCKLAHPTKKGQPLYFRCEYPRYMRLQVGCSMISDHECWFITLTVHIITSGLIFAIVAMEAGQPGRDTVRKPLRGLATD